MTTDRTRTALAGVIALVALIALVFGFVALVSWAGHRNDPDPHYYAAAECVSDVTSIVAPNDYCPIGDGVSNQGYSWAYREYRDTDHDIEVVYVGYPVDRHIWVHERPRRVPTINIDRGRFSPAPPAAAAGASSARVVTIAEERKAATAVTASTGSSTVTRGGLGVSRSARNAEAPAPARSLDSKAPGRAGEAKAAPLPKPPTSRVVVAATPKTKSGSK